MSIKHGSTVLSLKVYSVNYPFFFGLFPLPVHVFRRFPIGKLHGEDETKRWKWIRKEKINVRARQYRPGNK